MTTAPLKTIPSRRYSTVPGDPRRITTAAVTAEDGTEYPRGTVYTPISLGHDNRLPGPPIVSTVSISGAAVRFKRS